MYIIVAILIFGMLIMIHELGHFSIARACGVHIDEFSIGMGPKLLQKKEKKQGTLYTIRALPILGYVSMKGENEAEDAPDSFSSKKVWQRMAIVVAGAAMNLILGFSIVFIIVCMSRGQLASTTIHSFLDNATSNVEGGLCEGDTVVRVGNVSVYTGVVCEDGVFLGPSCVFTNVINPRSFIERKSEYRKTVVKKGASIGANATIGGNAFVTRSVPAGSTVTGSQPNL